MRRGEAARQGIDVLNSESAPSVRLCSSSVNALDAERCSGDRRTGDLGSWDALARALDAAGIRRPSGFTHEVVFRRCPACQEYGIVREDDFACVFCGGDLPAVWNVDPSA